MSYAREPEPEIPEPQPWRRNLVLFLLTVVAVLVTGAVANYESTVKDAGLLETIRAAVSNRESLVRGAQFTVSMLGILLAHEFGHYIAARIHKVDTSLPYFIPLPLLSPFGTMGAVIRMRGAIPTRRALLDIGASGPLAGLCVAIPLYCYGAAHSRIVPASTSGISELGESLLLTLLDHVAAPNVPDGQTLVLSPFAFAAWGGMFVTMINLLPVGQLDGGHVAYALFGKRQDVFARNIHRAVFVFFCGAVLVRAALTLHSHGSIELLGARVRGSLFWLSWFQMLAILGTLSRKDRRAPVIPLGTRIALTAALVMFPSFAETDSFPKAVLAWVGFLVSLGVMIWLEWTRGVFRPHALFDHPEVSDDRLDPVRVVIAVVSLLFFVALFMPTPFPM